MLKRCLPLTIGACGMILTMLSGIGLSADQSGTLLALVPQPAHVERKEGAFTLNKDTVILVQKDSADAANVGQLLAERLNRSTGLGIVVKPTEDATAVRNTILITVRNATKAMGTEGYQLTVTPEGAVITAAEGPGLFYGSQTLLQLLPPEAFSLTKVEGSVVWTAPAVVIDDRPRFRWRSLMVDCARHFFTKDEIKNFIDLMSQHKLNTFHWHLTEDQGWRIEIKRYPKLTEVGAWRKDIGFNLDPKSSTAYGPDGRYGGFYTQDDVREVVAYAKARYVNVVPEIELPGHAVAALAAYPELGCTGGPYSTDVKGGIFGDVFCAGNEYTYEFLEGVLTELLDLFPSKIIHIGGDEVPFDRVSWIKCAKCQERIAKEGLSKEWLSSEKELQSYFLWRIQKFLKAHGRSMIGWEEILMGGLPTSVSVMCWRRQGDVGAGAAQMGHEVVMVPGFRCYLSSGQGPVQPFAASAPPAQAKVAGADAGQAAARAKATQPPPKPRRGDPLTLEKVYSFEPVVPGIAADKAKFVIGSGGVLWSEGIPNYSRLQYMAYPRACATAEMTWLDPTLKNWEDFQKRVDAHVKRLKLQRVNYYGAGDN
jgi:hexosaminidase